MGSVTDAKLLWEPTSEFRESSKISRYMNWLNNELGLSFGAYGDLWKWSVENVDDFWESIWRFFDIEASKPYREVLSEKRMPRAKWFVGSQLNYAEHVFRNVGVERPALLFQSEDQPLSQLTWQELFEKTASTAHSLKEMGVKRGDRIVAYMPNIPETIIAFLACSSLGAIWSSCSPDFGRSAVLDRFKQIEPKVLFAVDGYCYNGRSHDRRKVVADLQTSLPTLKRTVLVPYLKDVTGRETIQNATNWEELMNLNATVSFEQVSFDHPLWVLYSSGTTGLPKAIVHSHGGILLEHLKALSLHGNLGPGDRFFWFTSTSWMMWNYLVGGLLTGSTIVLYDGSPSYPNMNALWDLAEKTKMTYFGTSAAYVGACMKAGIQPSSNHDLTELIGMGSTGSPLSTDAFGWVYQLVKSDVWLASISGGTDLCTAFVGGCPLLPVRAGEIQCRYLGANVESFDEKGRSIVDEMGELVITEPMPSMPIFFWNDRDDKRYIESYFDMFPGVWRHGDWIMITHDGSCVIYGRSDATIKRMGVRIGTSEIYRSAESIPEVVDSLVVDLEESVGRPYMPLFVVLKGGMTLDDSIKKRIAQKIREDISPRHVPDDIFAVPEVPKTLNGKKLEVPVKRILMGAPLEKAVNLGAVNNPDSIRFFASLAGDLLRKRERINQ